MQRRKAAFQNCGKIWMQKYNVNENFVYKMKFYRLTYYLTMSKQNLMTFNILIPFLITGTRVTNISSSVVNQSP